MGRWTETEKLEVQVMEARKTVLGPEHPDTLMTMWHLSHIFKELHRNDEALSVLQSCVQLQNQRLGPTHPYTVAATALVPVGRYQIAHAGQGVWMLGPEYCLRCLHHLYKKLFRLRPSSLSPKGGCHVDQVVWVARPEYVFLFSITCTNSLSASAYRP